MKTTVKKIGIKVYNLKNGPFWKQGGAIVERPVSYTHLDVYKRQEIIFMSSMIVYGESAPYGKKKIIDENTIPTPANFYGDSKLQADVAIRELADDNFKVIVLRPPTVSYTHLDVYKRQVICCSIPARLA